MVIPDSSPEELARFQALLLEVCGFSLKGDRETTLKAALRQRMTALGTASWAAYHATLLASRQEFNKLVELLTVNETYFFREPEHLKLVVDHLLPEIMQGREGPFRILSAGCSTGEEAYSLAILLRERFGNLCERLFSIVGVDIDDGVLQTARRGIFGRNSFRGVDPVVLEQYFEPAGGREYRIRANAGQLVSFETANLLGDCYPRAMQHPDIILYRNVSIYFPEQVQQEIFRHLADLLMADGYLIVGATETMHHDLGILPLVERNGLFIFWKHTEFTIVDRRATRRDGAWSPRQAQPLAVGRPGLNREERPAVAAHGPRPERTAPGLRRLFDDALEMSRTTRRQEALGVLEELLRQDPGFIKAYSLKAAILLNESRYPEAQKACEAALSLDPLTLEACLMLGVIARHEGKNDAAHQRFREAIYLDGACWMAHFYLAEILGLRGEIRRARSGYEAALRILGDASLRDRCLFPLAYKPEPFMAICRHKLSLPNKNG
jgi:chemotaxis protein methyltransferase CheR